MSREFKSAYLNGLSLKENSENLVVEGYIATDHVDDVGDYIPKTTLERLADRVNKSNQANKISLHHQRGETTMAGVMKNAKVQQTEDGHWGVMVEATVNPVYEGYADLSKEIEIGTIDGFSIEYETNKSHPQLMSVNGNNKEVRVLDEITCYGAGWASRPINDQAKITNHTYKEFIDLKEVSNMKQKEQETPEVDTPAKVEEVEEKTEEVSNDDSKESQSEEKPKEEVSEEKEYATKFKEFMKAEKVKETKEVLRSEMKEMLKEIQPTNQPLMQKGNNLEKKEVESKVNIDSYKKVSMECKEWARTTNANRDDGSAFRSKDINIQFKEAARLHNKFLEMYPQGLPLGQVKYGSENSWDSIPEPGFASSSDCGLASQDYEVKESHWKNLEIKGANPFTTTTSQLTDNAHHMAAPELADIYDPVIYNMLNDKTTFYGLLRKVDASKYSYAYEWRAIYGRAAVDGGLAEGGTITPDSTDRIILRQPFKFYYGAVRVTGQLVAASKGQGAVGDIVALEVKDVTRALLRDMNANLLVGTEDGSNDGNEALGLTYLCDDGTTYTDLYLGNSRNTYKLEGNSESASSANITKGRLRKGLRACEAGDSSLQANNGGVLSSADRSDLLIVTHHVQKDKILALFDDAQRFNSVSARAGFEGMPTFDGVPIHADNQCTSSVLFIVDMRHTFLAVQVPPTFTAWGQQYNYDLESGFIKTYFNLVCTKPGNNYMVTSLATA